MNEHVEPAGLTPGTLEPSEATTPTPAPVRVRRRRRWPWLVVLLIVIAGGIAWWQFRPAANVSYVTATVDRGSVTKTVSATGTVNPVLTVVVGSYVSGVIQEVLCDYNSKVTKGQVCARIDPRPFQSVVDQAQANLDIAKAQLQKDEANRDYAKLSFDRNTRLATQQTVTQDAADNAKSLYTQAQAQVALDNATIEQRQAELDAAKINLAYTNILSPVDGTVVSRNVTVGQTVASSFQTPTLFLIAQDLASMEVDNNISESDIGAVKAGEKAMFSVDAYPGRSFDGVVTAVRQAPQSVQNVVTYDVIVNVNNPDLSLMPGMTASTKIVVASRDNVLRVPTQALRYRPTGSAGSPRAARPRASGATPPASGAAAPPAAPPTAEDSARGRLFVLRNGQPVFVPVETGLDDGSFTEIVSGAIQAGDQIIIGESNGTASAAPAAAPRLRL